MTRAQPITRPILPGPAGPWWAALAALLAATGLAQGLAPHWRAQAAQADQWQRQLANSAWSSSPAMAPATAASDADRLASALPAVEQAPRRVADLLALAQAQGLAPQSIRQTWGSPGTGDAAGQRQLQVTVLLQGPYGALRTWVARALQQDAGLALDALHLEVDATTDRPAGSSKGLRAELQWSLLMRAAGPTAP